MKKGFQFLLVTLLFVFVLQPSALAGFESGSAKYYTEEGISQILDEAQKEQLYYEKLYLDNIFEIISKLYGSFEKFEQFGDFVITNDRGTRFVFLISEHDDRSKQLEKELSQLLPTQLLSIMHVDYSKHELLLLRNEILATMSNNFTKPLIDMSIDVDSTRQSVVITTQNETYYKEMISNKKIHRDGVIFEFAQIPSNEPNVSRDHNFSTMGGGIRISLSCSTAATATKDKREFLLTAGHCLKNIGGTVKQYTKNVGTEHFSQYKNYGTDVGVILLTDTTRSISNKFYYGELANDEYDKYYSEKGTAIVGQLVCKSGYTTGVTCGNILSNSYTVTYNDDNVTLTDMIRIHKDGGGYSDGGDSGAITFHAYRTQQIIGIHSGSNKYKNPGDLPTGTYGYATKISDALSEGGNLTLYTSNSTKAIDPNN